MCMWIVTFLGKICLFLAPGSDNRNCSVKTSCRRTGGSVAGRASRGANIKDSGKIKFILLSGQHLAQAPRPPVRIWQVLVDKVFSGFITGRVVQSGNWERTAKWIRHRGKQKLQGIKSGKDLFLSERVCPVFWENTSKVKTGFRGWPLQPSIVHVTTAFTPTPSTTRFWKMNL